MDFIRPSLKEICSRVQSDVASRANIALPMQKTSIVSALSYALSGAVHLLYGNIDRLSVQLFPDTATGAGLDRWASILGTKRRGKVSASGVVRFEGKVGAIVPKETKITTPAGVAFSTTEDLMFTDGTYGFTRCVALIPGSSGNTSAGVALIATTPIKDVAQRAVVLEGGLQGGFNEEGDDELRSRLLSRLRYPSEGGAAQDYTNWAQEISGVGPVWVSPGDQLFLTSITFLTSDIDHPIPSESMRSQVEQHLLKRKPLGSLISVYVCTPVKIQLSIELPEAFGSYRSVIETRLKLFFLRSAQPGITVSLYSIAEVISETIKTKSFRILKPELDQKVQKGQIAVLEGITWVSVTKV